MSVLEIKASHCTPKVSANVHKVCLACSKEGTFGNNPSRWQIHFGLHFASLFMCKCGHCNGYFPSLLPMRTWSVGHYPFQNQLLFFENGCFLPLLCTLE